MTKFDNREDLEVIRHGGEAAEKESPTASFPEHEVKAIKRVIENQTKVKKAENSSAKDPAEMSKHETIEIRMEDAKKVTPKSEAITSSNDKSDFNSRDASKEVKEEKFKALAPSEKNPDDASKRNTSEIRMDDVKKVTQKQRAKKSSNEKSEIHSEDARRAVSKQNEVGTPTEKTELRKGGVKSTPQEHDTAGLPHNEKVSTLKPEDSVSFDYRENPESKNRMVKEVFSDKDEDIYQAEARKCNWLSKRSKKSSHRKGHVVQQQREIVDVQESGYCGNLCSEQQLKDLQDSASNTMNRVWNYRHKILKMQNSNGSSNSCGSSFTENLHQFYDSTISVTRRVFDCSGDSCYTNSNNWGWFNNALSGRNTNTNPTHFKTVHSLFS